MKRSNNSNHEKEVKQCRFFLLLPLLILPFLTFLFWSVGLVGKGEAKASTTQSGLNTQLPSAKLKEDKNWNKLSFYEQADKDSELRTTAVKNDPFFTQKKDSTSFLGENKTASSYNPLPSNNEDANEYKVTQKLAQLNAAISSDRNDHPTQKDHIQSEQSPSAFQTKDVDRLERMLQAATRPDSSSDPETDQLNGMMDKILDIQHPERVTQRLQRTSEQNGKQVFPVLPESENCVSLLEKKGKTKRGNGSINVAKQNAFYSLNWDTVIEEKQNIIEAIVEETQTLMNGSIIKLTLKNDVYIGGIKVPEGTFLFGTTSFQNERLMVSISSVHYENNLLPVALSVYDLDGLPGIYIPGSVNRDIAKQTGSEALNNLGISSFDPSLGVQAANAGIAATKALITKKVKGIKVTVKRGYKVMLRDENSK